MTHPIDQHFKESFERAELQAKDKELQKASQNFMSRSHLLKYSYNFSWLGRPIIQYPQDILAFQECLFNVKPDLIIETGIAHGGSLILSASLLSLIDLMEGKDPKESQRKVLGIDIDIRSHNKEAIDNHPLRYKLNLIEGSSIDPKIIEEVTAISKKHKTIMVCLDSNHTHEHVYNELNAYAKLVSINSYCIVFDTVIENLPIECSNNRHWDQGNNPMTAVNEWIKDNSNFEIDQSIDNKLMISVAQKGFLKKLNN